MAIGERIAASRKEAGLTQAELGKKLGVTQQMITQIETGRRKPNADTITEIAKILDVSSAWLRYGDSIVTTKKPNDQKYLDLFTGVIDIEKIVTESIAETMKAIGQEAENNMQNLLNTAPEMVKGLGESAASSMQDILKPYSKLNEEGKKKAIEYTTDLAQMKKYQKGSDTKK